MLRSVELIQISQIYTLKVLSPLCGVNTDLTFVVIAVILPASTATACQRGLTRHPQAFYVSAKLSATCRNDCSCRLRCCSEMSQVRVSRRSYRHLHRRRCIRIANSSSAGGIRPALQGKYLFHGGRTVQRATSHRAVGNVVHHY